MIHRNFADNTNHHSVATRLRRQRFQILLDMICSHPDPIQILDIGGTKQYWDMMIASSDLCRELIVTLLNPEPLNLTHRNFIAMRGDGRAMPQFVDRQFDLVFSNSTIEHVGGFEDQKHMADEVRRVGREYYVQTPNRYFPIEPHFVFPFFQFFPVTLRVWLLQHFNLGWFSRIQDRSKAWHEVTSIRLLTRTEVEQLFPDGIIINERLYGFVKSFVVRSPDIV